MKITRFEDIEAWQLARDLCHFVYKITKREKFSKDFSMKDQICRASVSIMSNIAEGFDSGTNVEFARFLSYSQRSCSELQSELYVALDQAYINQEEFNEIYSLADKIKAKIGAFIKYLKNQRSIKRQTQKNQKPSTTN